MNQDILACIYEMDPTYHHHMKKCRQDIYHPMKNRIVREIERLHLDPDFSIVSNISEHLVSIFYKQYLFKIRIPPHYPFDPPIIMHNHKQFGVFDHWSPAATLMAAIITCHVELISGIELC